MLMGIMTLEITTIITKVAEKQEVIENRQVLGAVVVTVQTEHEVAHEADLLLITLDPVEDLPTDLENLQHRPIVRRLLPIIRHLLPMNPITGKVVLPPDTIQALTPALNISEIPEDLMQTTKMTIGAIIQVPEAGHGALPPVMISMNPLTKTQSMVVHEAFPDMILTLMNALCPGTGQGLEADLDLEVELGIDQDLEVGLDIDQDLEV